MDRIWRWATNLLLAVTSLLLAGVGGEFAWRAFRAHAYGPATNPGFVLFDPVLGWRYRPDAEVRHRTPEFDVDIRIDEAGRRAGLPSTRSEPRLVFVGDSMTFGWGVRGEQAFPSLVQDAFGGTAINLGVAGYSSDQELLKLRAEGLPLRPAAVVATFTDNDVGDVLAARRYGRAKPRFAVVAGELRLDPPAASWLERNSSLYRSWRYFSDRQREQPLDPQSTQHGRALVHQLLSTMAAEVAAAGSSFILVTANEPWLMDVPGAIDVHSALAASTEPVMFATDPHWNVVGHRIVAGQVIAALRGNVNRVDQRHDAHAPLGQ